MDEWRMTRAGVQERTGDRRRYGGENVGVGRVAHNAADRTSKAVTFSVTGLDHADSGDGSTVEALFSEGLTLDAQE